MTLEEAATALRACGLDVHCWKDMIHALADRSDGGGLTCYGWVCGIRPDQSKWLVKPPPHLCPGPGMTFTVQTLEEAVSLTLFAFAHRRELDERSPEWPDRLNQMYNEWVRSTVFVP